MSTNTVTRTSQERFTADLKAGKFDHLLPKGTTRADVRVVVVKSNSYYERMNKFVEAYYGDGSALGFMDDECQGYENPDFDRHLNVLGYDVVVQKTTGELCNEKFYACTFFNRIVIGSTLKEVRYLAWMDYDKSNAFGSSDDRSNHIQAFKKEIWAKEAELKAANYQNTLEKRRETEMTCFGEIKPLQLVVVTKSTHRSSRWSPEYKGQVGIVTGTPNSDWYAHVLFKDGSTLREWHSYFQIVEDGPFDHRDFKSGKLDHLIEKHQIHMFAEKMPNRR